jgi:heterogeneous nuclear ribonucleoprotein A1/A3
MATETQLPIPEIKSENPCHNINIDNNNSDTHVNTDNQNDCNDNSNTPCDIKNEGENFADDDDYHQNNNNNNDTNHCNGDEHLNGDNNQNGHDNNGNGNDNHNDNDNDNGNENCNDNENNNCDQSNMEPEQFRKVFIGGLSYKTDDETLKTYFSKYGELVDYVVMKDGSTGRSRGFGFVTYSDSTMVDELMKNRPHIIDGRQVEPKRATPREDSGKQEVQMTVKKLFIGGLRDALTEDDLKEYFSSYGDVVEAVVMKEKESNKSRGFGFVTFDDYDPVDKIILEKNHTIKGVNIHTQKALPKDYERNQGGGGGGGGRGGNFGGNNFRNDNFGGNNGFNNGGGGGGGGFQNRGFNNRGRFGDQNGGGGGGGYNNQNRFNNNNNNFDNGMNGGGGNGFGGGNTYGSYNQASNQPKMNPNMNQMGGNMNPMGGMGGPGMNNRGMGGGGPGMGNKMGGGPGPMRGGARFANNRSAGPYGGG